NHVIVDPFPPQQLKSPLSQGDGDPKRPRPQDGRPQVADGGDPQKDQEWNRLAVGVESQSRHRQQQEPVQGFPLANRGRCRSRHGFRATLSIKNRDSEAVSWSKSSPQTPTVTESVSLSPASFTNAPARPSIRG